jgi:hypothetical protein
MRPNYLFSLAATRLRRAGVAAVLAWIATGSALAAPGKGKFELTVIDADSGEVLPCRMHLKAPSGQPRRVGRNPFWHDHFVFSGELKLELPPGTYTFELERGPEYARRSGHFVIDRFSDDRRTVEMKRHVDMAQEGWWSGDLHIHRPLEQIELLMRAEDLHVAPVITWWNKQNLWADKELPAEPLVRFDGNRYFQVLAGEDERAGGALLYFQLPRPLAIAGAGPEFPSPMKFLVEARKSPDAWVDIEKPFWWDVPTWLASGQVDSIGLANNHQCRGEMHDNEAWGKPRDKARFRGPWGNGEWSQAIYYHILNSGLRLPPSAGSASGVLPNPVGYNRIYVFCGQEFTYQGWWQAFRQGRVMVTNGPLLRPVVNGEHYPGHVFQATEGGRIEIDIALDLATSDAIRYLEIIKDGQVERSVRLEDYAQAGGRLPTITFDRSGWFLVRAVTEVPETYRFASTGPYYVEIGDQPRISRASAQFFLSWVEERMGRIKLEDDSQLRAVMQHHEAARRFWRERVERANAD